MSDKDRTEEFDDTRERQPTYRVSAADFARAMNVTPRTARRLLQAYGLVYEPSVKQWFYYSDPDSDSPLEE